MSDSKVDTAKAVAGAVKEAAKGAVESAAFVAGKPVSFKDMKQK